MDNTTLGAAADLIKTAAPAVEPEANTKVEANPAETPTDEHVCSIDELIDLGEYGPEKSRLKSYIGKTITVTGFEKVDSEIHKDKPTVKLYFLDDESVARKTMTSAKYITKLMFAIQEKNGFGLPDSKVKQFKAMLLADNFFGKHRNYRLAAPTKTTTTNTTNED